MNSNKRDIYFENFIYLEVPTGGHLWDSNKIPVQGGHNWENGEDVTGRYELKTQARLTGRDKWYFVNENVHGTYITREVAIPLPTPAPVAELQKGAEGKAKELVEKFHYQICNDNGLSENDSTEFCAKQCAIICVDEILKCYNWPSHELNHWQQVRTAINQL